MGGVLTDITFILDRSGSMAGLVDDTIGGFNTFLAEQKKVAGAANVTLVSFADGAATVYAGRPLADAPPLTRETYSPSGNTALYDAICETVDAAGARFAMMPESERPGMVMVVIITDGEENHSRKFSREDVFQRITPRRSEGPKVDGSNPSETTIRSAGPIGRGASFRNWRFPVRIRGGAPRLGDVPQSAEGAGSKPDRCGFESHRLHHPCRSPSGKAAACKAAMRESDSPPALQL